LYRKYAELLVTNGYAYYAFDTPEELEKMRQAPIADGVKTEQSHTQQYDHTIRMKMRNSLTLAYGDVKKLLEENTPHVIRIKLPEQETISFRDIIRGEVSFDTSLVDDKVLLKADGMPTYHLAVVVDDYLMKVSHAFRGEEWLPSAPVHILLWKYLFGLNEMPQWAHLPLILGPSGKLSKRDGAKYGFPVFAMNWTDPKTGELIEGFKEKGFLPEAFINFLALLGWNDGSEKEIFTKEELVEKFSIERVHSGGAKFDYEKAKWFNHEWMKKSEVGSLESKVKSHLSEKGLSNIDVPVLDKVISLVKDRCTLLTDFYDQSWFFFKAPEKWDVDAVKPKWNESKKLFFAEVVRNYELDNDWTAAVLEKNFKEIAAVNEIKPGEVLLPFRIMLVGGKFGPGVFDIAEIIGKSETISRIKKAIFAFSE
jgi:glutamyl-tRNA synthetase